MNETAVRRKYALTKLAAGDYLLPSNDAKTIWRIHTYTDGPSAGITSWPHDVQFWALRKWIGHTDRPRTIDDLDDWNLWELYDDHFGKRKEAIDKAMQNG